MSTRNAALRVVDTNAFCFDLPARERSYRVPFAVPLKPRNPAIGRDRSVARVDGTWGENARIIFADGGRRSTIGSLCYDYDLSSYAVEGDALPASPIPRGDGAPSPGDGEDADVLAEETPEPAAGSEAIVVASIAGLPLEVVQNEWVTLRSLYEPFGKRVDKQIASLSGWALVRKFRLTPKGVDGDSVAAIPNDAWCVHRTHAAQAITDLSTVGMPEDIRTAFIKYKRECAAALDAYFTTGAAVNPRIAPAAGPDVTAILDAIRGVVVSATQAELQSVRELAQRALDAAGQPSGLDAAARAAGPAEVVTTPDGTFVKAAPEGYLSMRSVARKYALPTDGAGANLVGAVARCLEITEDPEAAIRGPVTSCGVVTSGSHLRYGGKAIARMDASLRRAHRCMLSHGYAATHGSLRPLGGDTQDGKRRSAVYVAARMLEAALSDPADTSH